MARGRKKIAASTIAATSVVSISMVLFMLGLIVLAVWFGKKKSDELKENVEFIVFFKRDVPEADIMKIKARLESRPMVKEIAYRNAATVSQEYQKELGKDFLDVTGFNPLGGELIVKLKAEFGSDASLIELKTLLLRETAVRDVDFTQAVMDNINENVRRVSLIAASGLLIFLIVTLALINGTIRLQIFSQRFIIKSMQLVGAKKWFIIKPFVFSSVKYGIYGVFLSWVFLGGLMFAAYSYDQKLGRYYTLEEIAILAASLLVLGISFTTLSSFFVTRRYLKLNIEQLY